MQCAEALVDFLTNFVALDDAGETTTKYQAKLASVAERKSAISDAASR